MFAPSSLHRHHYPWSVKRVRVLEILQVGKGGGVYLLKPKSYFDWQICFVLNKFSLLDICFIFRLSSLDVMATSLHRGCLKQNYEKLPRNHTHVLSRFFFITWRRARSVARYGDNYESYLCCLCQCNKPYRHQSTLLFRVKPKLFSSSIWLTWPSALSCSSYAEFCDFLDMVSWFSKKKRYGTSE